MIWIRSFLRTELDRSGELPEEEWQNIAYDHLQSTMLWAEKS